MKNKKVVSIMQTSKDDYLFKMQTSKDDYQYFISVLLNDNSLNKDRFISFFGIEELEELKNKGYCKRGL